MTLVYTRSVGQAGAVQQGKHAANTARHRWENALPLGGSGQDGRTVCSKNDAAQA